MTNTLQNSSIKGDIVQYLPILYKIEQYITSLYNIQPYRVIFPFKQDLTIYKLFV